MVILDTDHMSLLEWSGSPPTQKLETRLRQLNPDEICTTVISYEEQFRGWMNMLAKATKQKDQIEIYRRLKNQLNNYCRLIVLTFDDHAAVEFARLRKDMPRLGTMDLKIAAIALAQNATLLSRNRRDFGQIAGLQLEDWTT
ncbi:MAG: type II toxin-antitoxin system VapC family toxin [Gemmataceae bacterium]